MRNRINRSQNFLVNNRIIENLIGIAGLNKNDSVIEIGAGKGIITKGLIDKAGEVIAYENDPYFFEKLSEKFQNEKHLKLKQEDFLTSDLPTNPYKIFSNIPFSITSAIIKKLTLTENPPEDTFLIIQKEAAMKFAGKPLDEVNSQQSVILNPWFEFKVVYEFKPTDFFPTPNVDIVLIEIKKREQPLVQDKDLYRDFVTHSFNRPKKSTLSKNSRPSELDFNTWITLFHQFLGLPEKNKNVIRGSFIKQLKEQQSIEKIHRTRIDKNWRDF